MGARLDWLDLEIVIPLCLLGLVGAGLRAAGARAVIVVAGAVALLTASWPAGTGLLAAVAAGSATGIGKRPQEPVMTWLVILAVGAGSFVFRLGPLLVFQRITLTERGDRVIRHAGTAAITALIVVSTQARARPGAPPCRRCWRWASAVVLAARGASMLRLLVCGGGDLRLLGHRHGSCVAAMTDAMTTGARRRCGDADDPHHTARSVRRHGRRRAGRRRATGRAATRPRS